MNLGRKMQHVLEDGENFQTWCPEEVFLRPRLQALCVRILEECHPPRCHATRA